MYEWSVEINEDSGWLKSVDEFVLGEGQSIQIVVKNSTDSDIMLTLTTEV